MNELAEPTDATFLAQKERVGAEMRKWKDILPLGNWEITPIYDRAPMENEHDGAGSWKVVAETRADWRYLQATIRWNILQVMDCSDDDLGNYVRHEYLHILLDRLTRYARGEYPDCVIDQGMVEESTSMLELAIRWAYNAGVDEGRELQEKESMLDKQPPNKTMELLDISLQESARNGTAKPWSCRKSGCTSADLHVHEESYANEASA